MNSTDRFGRRLWDDGWALAAVFGLALVVRLYAFRHTYIINPDGILYISQARAIWYGQWEAAVQCSLSYFSIYPFLISGAHFIVADWVQAAKTVSFLCSFLTLIPLYLLFRTLFDRPVSTVGVLVYALMPHFVSVSADVLRGPAAGLFLVLGLLLFAKGVEQSSRLGLAAAGICFLLAGWARIEMALPLPVAAVFLLFSGGGRWRRLFYFLLPVICLAGALVLFLAAHPFPLERIYRAGEIFHRLSALAAEYGGLQKGLEAAARQSDDLLTRLYLLEAKNLLWFTGFGLLLTATWESFYLPYLIIALAGLGPLRSTAGKAPVVRYYVAVVIAGFFMLYASLLGTWILHNRHMAVVIFPSFVFIGLGCRRVLGWLRNRFALKKATALTVLAALVAGAGFVYSWEKREADKQVYRQIAAAIDDRESGKRYAPVAGACSPVLEWVAFYANLQVPGVPCPRTLCLNSSPGHRLDALLAGNEAVYLLCEENLWNRLGWDWRKLDANPRLRLLGEWRHADTGLLRLFQLVPPSGDASPAGRPSGRTG